MTNLEVLKRYNLQVIVIKRPYDTYRDSEFTRNFMRDVFKLKLDGYCPRYPYGILPISDYDFMATHVCLAHVKDGNFFPISAFKSVTSEDCKDFRAPFPVINHKFGMFQENFSVYIEALKNWENQLKGSNEIYAYNSSWTMQNDLPKDLRDLTRELSYVLLYHHYTSSNIKHVINSTSVNFKVSNYQEMMGLNYLQDSNGNILPPFNSPVFYEEPFFIMYLNENGFSELFSKRCELYKNLWENRIVINKENIEIIPKVA